VEGIVSWKDLARALVRSGASSVKRAAPVG
jgi:hypothetical protein